VTQHHCQACALPFMVCVGFDRGKGPTEEQRSHLTLRFCESDGELRVLGEIGLRWERTLESGNAEFFLFRTRNAVNRCMPRIRFLANTMWHAFSEVRGGRRIRMSGAERRAMAVMFICPRPVSLVSVATTGRQNIFPLNVMGNLNEGFFAFCLKQDKLPAQFVEETGRIAMSSVPMKESPVAYTLGPNHNKTTVELDQLSFATRPSPAFGIPVPEFALRVREMEVAQMHKLGHHTFFLARVITDEHFVEGPEFCVAHGFYQDWRVKQRNVDGRVSYMEDAFVRNLISPEQMQDFLDGRPTKG